MSQNLLPPYIITLDVDWAPDFMIDYVAQILIDYNVKATWFITHESPAIDRLRQNPDLFEIGAHPNFLSGSIHGQTPEEVWRQIRKIAPEAVSIRTHGLYQSSWYYIEAIREGFLYDVSTLLPGHPCPAPVSFQWSNGSILKIPFVWEDDVEFQKPEPCWQGENINTSSYPAILNFHPVHIYLNSENNLRYQNFKKLFYNNNNISSLQNLINPGPGTATFFRNVFVKIANSSATLKELGEIYLK